MPDDDEVEEQQPLITPNWKEAIDSIGYTVGEELMHPTYEMPTSEDVEDNQQTKPNHH